MAKNKKKKRPSKVPHSTLKSGISKAQFDTGCVIARKTLHLMGVDSALFDMLSKKQKHALLEFEIHVPVIRVKSGNHVPRQYLNNIRASTLTYMRTDYIDRKTKLTYMEFFTYGIPFLCAVKIKNESGMFTSEQKNAFVEKTVEKFLSINLFTSELFMGLYANLWFDLSFYSQVNFRTYGFAVTADIPRAKELISKATLRYVIELTSHESESTYFTHNKIKRKAFKMLVGNTFLPEPPPGTITHKTLFPESKFSAKYTIHLQSHAIHRFKERIDIVDAPARNHLISFSLTVQQKVVIGANGRSLISCFVHGVPFGYFPYTIQGNNLFIMSFLPFVNRITPEGAKLYSILNLSKDELIYLGMDKLSFYVAVDFDEIPVLKNALIESGIWQIKKELDEGTGGENEIDRVKTQFVKNFFLKTEARRIQMLEDNEADAFEEEWTD
ncbi:MAG: hypothetical protein LBQ01_02415 [Prevotellaceae bacterium]|jgi:hypothetical protein|nr:hypothetical protein [Prevotellaceae bacterium]